ELPAIVEQDPQIAHPRLRREAQALGHPRRLQRRDLEVEPLQRRRPERHPARADAAALVVEHPAVHVLILSRPCGPSPARSSWSPCATDARSGSTASASPTSPRIRPSAIQPGWWRVSTTPFTTPRRARRSPAPPTPAPAATPTASSARRRAPRSWWPRATPSRAGRA